MSFLMIFYCFAAFFCILYVALMFFYIIGWYRLKTYKKNSSEYTTKVSVIVPARNEEENIENCLNDIARQDFPKELFEIIAVDDYSTDSTIERIEKLIDQHKGINVTLIKLKGNKAPASYPSLDVLGGKKRAITKAIEQSEGDLIVTTDADCRMGSNWLSTIVSYYESQRPKMIVAPVCLYNPKCRESFFEKLQMLEFIGLIGATGAAIEQKHPIMCNGANLAYEKSVFKTVQGFNYFNAKHSELASGDDMHLMLKIKNSFADGIKFIKSEEAVVYTKPKISLLEFIQQRKRWTSKTLTYKDFTVVTVASIVYVFNILIVICLVLMFFTPPFIGWLFIFIFGAKCIIDFLFLFLTTSFFKRRSLMWLYLPGQVFNLCYVTFIGIIGNLGKYRWKGRIIK